MGSHLLLDNEVNGGFDSGATAWVLCCAALVLLMSLPGLAIFYGGFVRSKNVLSVLFQTMTISVVSSVLWVAVGYSFVFSDGGPLNGFIGGFEHVFLVGAGPNVLLGRPGAAIPLIADAFYQGTYCFLAPALIVGSVVERMKSKAVLIFAAFFLIFVYCPVAHSLWAPGGFLGAWGCLDWAGGLVVGTTAGVAGLVASVVVGPRDGYPEASFRPHNTTLIVIGTGMLWVGWLGFEAGTGLRADGIAALACFTTHTGGAFGALTWVLIEWLLHHGRPSILGFCAGAISGLAAITPTAGYVSVAGSAAIGVLGTIICYVMAVTVKSRVGWDETLDAFGIHATGGMSGTILLGIFGSPALGGISGPDWNIWEQLGKQLVATVFVIVYTAAVSYILLRIISASIDGLRVSADDEDRGLDVSELDDGAYIFGINNWESGAEKFVSDDATNAGRLITHVLRREVSGTSPSDVQAASSPELRHRAHAANGAATTLPGGMLASHAGRPLLPATSRRELGRGRHSSLIGAAQSLTGHSRPTSQSSIEVAEYQAVEP